MRYILTHYNNIGHPSKGGLLNLRNLVLVNAQLLEAFWYVRRNLLQKILRQVESLQVDQRRKGLGVDNGDLIVYQDERLEEEQVGN